MKSRWLIVGVSIVIVMLALMVSVSLAQGPDGGNEAQDIVSIAGTVSAKISYQGVLKENGQPVTGSRDMIFRLYSDSSCTIQVSNEITKTGVQVTDGLFSVDLEVDPDNFNGQALWLEVEVGGTKIGCQEILPVPYALSLRPGAVITTTTTDVRLNYSFLYGAPLPIFSREYGVYAKVEESSLTSTGYAVYGSANTDGYAGYFTNSSGTGVYARGGSDGAADLILGGNSSTEDNGVIRSDPTYTNSDIVLVSSDNVRIDLDDDADDSDSDFEIYDENDNVIFAVDDSGDVSQPLTADGLLKAAVYAYCGSSGSTTYRYFNQVNGVAITIANGTSVGRCTIDFNFDLSNRFWIAMPVYTTSARTISCDINSTDSQKLDCARFDINGNGANGGIMVLVY
ncbi:MAG TPA: hypothetical protein G4O00_11090 [Thermoflexia bacterium]|nr:hypothetical protein [Thermoflexia bacterium]